MENFISQMFMSIDQYLRNIRISYPVRDFFLILKKSYPFFEYLGEYIGGALRWEDLILYATEAGFTQPRLVTAKPVTIKDEDIVKAIGKKQNIFF